MIKGSEQFIKMQSEAFAASVAALEQAFKGAKKMADLNVASAQDAVQSTVANVKALMAVKDPQAFAALLSQLGQDSPEKLQTYATDAYAISKDTLGSLRSMAQSRLAESQEAFVAAISTALANSPGGSEAAVGFLKAALDSANKAYAQAVGANKQIFEAAETNLSGAAKQFTGAAAKAGAKKR